MQNEMFTLGKSFCMKVLTFWGFPGDASGKEVTCQCRRCQKQEFEPWVGKILWRSGLENTPVFLPGESYGHRSLKVYCPQDLRELNMTEVILHASCYMSINSDDVSREAQSLDNCILALYSCKKLQIWYGHKQKAYYSTFEGNTDLFLFVKDIQKISSKMCFRICFKLDISEQACF